MICKQKEARVHLTEMSQGQIKKVDLCEECAKNKGVDDPTGFSLADLLMGLGASQELAQGGGVAGASCPSCGFSQGDFKKAGRLGCPDCYAAFAEGLAGLLKTMHRGVRHVGKTPGTQRPPPEVGDRLDRLQKELAQAIAVENYEEAARLRDQIKALKEGSSTVLPA
jgi:protein arginine kinase activator